MEALKQGQSIAGEREVERMSVQTSWVSEAPAVNHSASYEIRTGDKMRVEATGRTEMAENCIVSEAGLIEPQDELLMEEAINSSSAAFGVLFERCERKVFHVARNTLRNREDADDAVQQAFERAYVHLKGFQGQSRFSTWLTRIAINEALMLLCKRHSGHVSIERNKVVGEKGTTFEIQDAAATPQERCEAPELRGIPSVVIGELKPILGKVVELHDIGELSTQETAESLGLPNGTVKARLFRARCLLRRKLVQRYGLTGCKAVGSLFLEP